MHLARSSFSETWTFYSNFNIEMVLHVLLFTGVFSGGSFLGINWHSLSTTDAARILKSDLERGISPEEARRRLAKNGPNAIERRRSRSLISIFLEGFRDPMVLTLLAATAVSFAMGETIDALVIAAIVVLNALMGTVQEYRAERALDALARYAPEKVIVIRGGRRVEVDKETIVPGDLLVLSPGDRVSADVRITSTRALQIDEAVLTGESVPVLKDSSLILEPGTPLAERGNMAYAGTLVIMGEGLGLVVATGMETELGRIARLVASAEAQKTPLEQKLESLGAAILKTCIAVSALTACAGVIRGLPFHEMFLTGVSLAVAAVPEGLPAVVTLCMAIGVRRMARKGALVRKLEAIETLGSVTVICTDKTGTLTQNSMQVSYLAIPGPSGGPLEMAAQDIDRALAVEILQTAALASDARHRRGLGLREDPTEQAIVDACHECGIDVISLDQRFPRIASSGFSPERRMMSVVVNTEKGALLCVKGAPDTVIPKCVAQEYMGKMLPITREVRQEWDRWVDARAGEGMRVLAVASKMLGQVRTRGEDIREEGLVLVGCLALSDPLRSEAASAVARCKRAGIRPVLVTGDHLRTAENVARLTGMISREERGITGEVLSRLNGREKALACQSYRVFARVSPEHKLEIVRSLKEAGHVVAMTGDGINDAPALKEAAVGIAMGLGGTDVAREASSIILTDDNFATIVEAITEGRVIYSNIRKFIRYLFSCNLGEIIVMSTASLLGLPMPLGPTQLLWMNLVTDGLPALALGLDPPEKDVMNRPPRNPSEGLFSGGLLRLILTRAIYIAAATLTVFLSALPSGHKELASTMAYATLVTIQLVSAFDCRSETLSVVELGLLSNPYLCAGGLVSWMMLFATIQVPAVARFFHTVPLSWHQWALVFASAALPDLFRYSFLGRKE